MRLKYVKYTCVTQRKRQTESSAVFAQHKARRKRQFHQIANPGDRNRTCTRITFIYALIKRKTSLLNLNTLLLKY